MPKQHDQRVGRQHVHEEHPRRLGVVLRGQRRQLDAERLERPVVGDGEPAQQRHDDEQRVDRPMGDVAHHLLPRLQRGLVGGSAVRQAVDEADQRQQQDRQADQLVGVVELAGRLGEIRRGAVAHHEQPDRDLRGDQQHRPPVEAPRGGAVGLVGPGTRSRAHVPVFHARPPDLPGAGSDYRIATSRAGRRLRTCSRARIRWREFR